MLSYGLLHCVVAFEHFVGGVSLLLFAVVLLEVKFLELQVEPKNNLKISIIDKDTRCWRTPWAGKCTRFPCT